MKFLWETMFLRKRKNTSSNELYYSEYGDSICTRSTNQICFLSQKDL